MNSIPSKPRFQALILDMDGLVLDTEPGYFRAWQIAARALGFELPDAAFQSLSGQSLQTILQLLYQWFGADFPQQRFLSLATQHWERQIEQWGITPKPGFFELMTTVEQLQLPYCLATNSPRKNALYCLQLAGIRDYFQFMVCVDEVVSGKPAPDLFLAASRCIQTAPEHCLVVEDSEPGIQAACQANMTAVLITSHRTATAGRINSETLAILPSLREVTEFLLP